MKVKFWGTRGSIPVATNAQYTKDKLKQVLQQAIKARISNESEIDAFLSTLPFVTHGSYGGNTSCVQICDDSQEYTLCDMGTGLREFGSHVLSRHRKPQIYNVFMSHLHWDHIMGFPFFTPAYKSGNIIRIYGCHQQLETSFRQQHKDPNFPVDFDQLGADIEFITLEPGKEYHINGFKITAKLQIHKGDSYGYRFEKGGKCLVYSTDSEHKLEDQQYLLGVVNFFKNADAVIFDAMYSLLESITYKKDWGHSNNLTGVELCQRANVKQLCLFHHEPTNSDQQIDDNLYEALDFERMTRNDNKQLDICSTYDGLEIEL
ncbi:MAG: MBL fold metallo-hydrolase [Algicola sp.]|nr:MBL fold metallo-hydrolase [Algicola sp.]